MVPPRNHAIITLYLSSVNELASAQQSMYELTVTRVSMRPQYNETSLQKANYSPDCKSVSFPVAAHNKNGAAPYEAIKILRALEQSKHKLIIRQWKRGACWWNCNTNNNDLMTITRGSVRLNSNIISEDEYTTTLQMARAEVEGYRLARLALMDTNVHVADVLYFSHDDPCPAALKFTDGYGEEGASIEKQIYPWVILSYFDYYTGNVDRQTDDSHLFISEDFSFDVRFEKVDSATTMNISSNQSCNHYPTNMIKIRHEYGFKELHPRHGRVCREECLDYVTMVLRDVVLPLQKYFFFKDTDQFNGIDLTSISCEQMRNEQRIVSTSHAFRYLDMVSICIHAVDYMSTSTKYNRSDDRANFLLNILKKCCTSLHEEWIQMNISDLPPVLCHMDLQPQNLAFFHQDASTANSNLHDASKCRVAAIMDWEEACYADPRYEIVLTCRKVLANRNQAEIIWQSYSEQVQTWQQELMTKHKRALDWNVGPIEPWLKLECVHSLCTMVIQLLNSVVGGRCPWETKTDLIGKIDRERQRLKMMGWHFCDDAVE